MQRKQPFKTFKVEIGICERLMQKKIREGRGESLNAYVETTLNQWSKDLLISLDVHNRIVAELSGRLAFADGPRSAKAVRVRSIRDDAKEETA